MGVYCKISRRPLEIRAAKIEYCSHVRALALRNSPSDPACYHTYLVFCTRLYIYIYVHIYIYIHRYVSIYVCIYIDMCIYVYIYIYRGVYIYIERCIYIYIYIIIHMYGCMYVCVDVYTAYKQTFTHMGLSENNIPPSLPHCPSQNAICWGVNHPFQLNPPPIKIMDIVDIFFG